MAKTRESNQCSAAPPEESLKRCETLRLLAAKSHLTTREMDESANKLGIRRAYLYRLLAAFRRRPRTSTLLPKAEGRKTGTRFMSPEIELIVESTIHSFYLQRIKPPFSPLVKQVQAECHREGLKAPDRKTILRRVSALDERKVTASRQGLKAARARYDPIGQSPVITQALERVQIDHTPIDLIIVDERNRKPLGRPWLTLANAHLPRMPNWSGSEIRSANVQLTNLSPGIAKSWWAPSRLPLLGSRVAEQVDLDTRLPVPVSELDAYPFSSVMQSSMRESRNEIEDRIGRWPTVLKERALRFLPLTG